MDAVARSPASPGVDGFDRASIEQFLIHEALLLDGRRFRDWMGLFADDGTYWVPAAPEQASPFDQASLFYDDRDLMRTRIERLEEQIGTDALAGAGRCEGSVFRQIERQPGPGSHRPSSTTAAGRRPTIRVLNRSHA